MILNDCRGNIKDNYKWSGERNRYDLSIFTGDKVSTFHLNW